MKRRDFIRVSSAAGVMGLMGPAIDAVANPLFKGDAGFDLHPFIRGIPKRFSLTLHQLPTNLTIRVSMMLHSG